MGAKLHKATKFTVATTPTAAGVKQRLVLETEMRSTKMAFQA